MSARVLNVLTLVVVSIFSFHFHSAALAQTPAAKPKPAATLPSFGGGIQTQAKQDGTPDMTSETYGDWIIRCQKVSDARRCELSQTLVLQGQSAPVALIAFGRDKKADPMRMVIQLPTNVTLEGGVKVSLASGDSAVNMTFRRCFPTGCFADATLTDADIGKFKATAEPLSITFKDGSERDIALPLSLKGFGSAFDALLRS